MPVSFPEYKQQVELAPVQRQQVVVNNASNAPGLDALGRGVSQFGQGMGVYNARREAAEQRERDKADQLRVRSVLAEISSGKRDFLETPLDADGNGGFLNKRGKNAIDASAADSKVFQQFVQGKVEGLTPSQRALINASVEAELESFNHSVDRHVVQETNQYNEDTSKALLSTRSNAVTSAYLRGDRATAEEEFGAGLGEVDNISSTMGEPRGGPIHAKRVADYTDSTRRGVLEAMLGSDPAEAERLFAEWQPSLNQGEVARTKLGERIKDASDRWHAGAIAESAIMEHGYQAAEMIQSMPADKLSADMKAIAINDVNRRFAEADKFQDAADSEYLGKLSQTISRGQGLYTIQDLERDPDFKRLGKEQAKANAYNMVEAQRRIKSKNPGDHKKQSLVDREAIAKFNRMAAETPQLAADLDTDSVFSNTSDVARDQIGTLRAKLKEDIASGNAMKTTEMTQLAKSKMKWMREEKAAAALAGLLEEMQAYRDENDGKFMPREKALQRIDFYTTKGEIDGSGLFFNDSGTAADAEARGRPFIPPKDAKPSKPSAPAPAAPKPGLVRMKEAETGKVFYLTEEQAAAAEKAGAGTRF